ncbi:MAG: hypothetical protein IT282_14995 [Bacteroidetes bacterium]|nr:hypothetical protein [Bacteroidota bacterium]
MRISMLNYLKPVLAACAAAMLILPSMALSGEDSEGTMPPTVSLVLVGHGGVPNDYPNLKEFFRLHDKGGDEFEKIEEEMIHWPRTESNDAYWAGFMKVVGEIRNAGKYLSVHPAFNEFCAPTVDEALAAATAAKPDVIIVTSIMLTPGGVHSERDIPASIESFREENPSIRIVYAWPYDLREVAQFVNMQSTKFIQDRP